MCCKCVLAEFAQAAIHLKPVAVSLTQGLQGGKAAVRSASPVSQWRAWHGRSAAVWAELLAGASPWGRTWHLPGSLRGSLIPFSVAALQRYAFRLRTILQNSTLKLSEDYFETILYYTDTPLVGSINNSYWVSPSFPISEVSMTFFLDLHLISG